MFSGKTAFDAAYPAGVRLIGMFRLTNYWDFIIYFVVTGGVVLITNIIQFDGKENQDPGSDYRSGSGDHCDLFTWLSLPFTLQFDTMVQGVALAQNHSWSISF